MKLLVAVVASLLAELAAAAPTRRSARTPFAGVNLAGLEFGCDTDGTCKKNAANTTANYAAQIRHFAYDDKLNLFRLPVAWQYLVSWRLGDTLDRRNVAVFDRQVQACLATGAHCIVDVHNYGRWNGQVIGAPGGPSHAQFADLWWQLAAKYQGQDRVVFGLMNEPHDLPSAENWAAACQAAVTAIRAAGAWAHMILLPGDGYAAAGALAAASSGVLAALHAVTNPDGSTVNLVFDVHAYLDRDSSGRDPECVTNQIDGAFAPLAVALRRLGRQALVTETGGGNTASCEQHLCALLGYLESVGPTPLPWLRIVRLM